MTDDGRLVIQGLGRHCRDRACRLQADDARAASKNVRMSPGSDGLAAYKIDRPHVQHSRFLPVSSAL